MAERRQHKRKQSREQREEFEQVILDLARVTRVMAGGKRMRFRACVALGDRKGRVGVGLAKGADVSLAISKATNDAKKKIIKVRTTDTGTIPHQARIRSYSAKLLLKPAPPGTGIIAGSVLRQIFELAGIRDIVGKILGTSNKVNNAKAAIAVLQTLREPLDSQRGKKTAQQVGSKKQDKAEAEENIGNRQRNAKKQATP